MKKKFTDFMRENGFLIFLFVCVCIVAISTILMVTRDPGISRLDDDQDLVDQDENQADIGGLEEVSKSRDEEEDKEKLREVEEGLEDQEEEVEDRNPGNESQIRDRDQKEEKKQGPKSEKQGQDRGPAGETSSFIMPLDGKIITDFASDKLIYSETLDEWRGHTGIDIKASSGSVVGAAGQGTVKEAYQDPLWGNVVVIDHGNEILTRYAGLGSKEMAEVGLRVKQGDKIGIIGKSPSIEAKMEEHLHYELIKNGKYLDPRSIK